MKTPSLTIRFRFGRAGCLRVGVMAFALMVMVWLAKSSNTFFGGRNLHRSSFAPTVSYKMPVFLPHC